MRYGFAHDDAEYDDADDGSDVESLQLAEAMDLLETRYAAHLAGKDYALALQHAQLIIDILHAASVSGYLKLAECHELLQDPQAAIHALSAIPALTLASGLAVDAAALESVRQEQCRLEAKVKAINERKRRDMVSLLPQILFLRIMDYLPEQDLIRAAQTNKSWRSVIHDCPSLWSSLTLVLPGYRVSLFTFGRSSEDDRYNEQQVIHRLELLNRKIKFYQDRLPDDDEGSRGLQHLNLHFQYRHPFNYETGAGLPKWLEWISTGDHRFIRKNLQSLSISSSLDIPNLLPGWSARGRLDSLSCFRVTSVRDRSSKFTLANILRTCPRLEQVILLPSTETALEPMRDPILESHDGVRTDCRKGQTFQDRSLKRFIVYGHEDFVMEAGAHHFFTNLEYIELGALPETYRTDGSDALLLHTLGGKLGPNFLVPFSMHNLRTLRLVDAQFSTSFQWYNVRPNTLDANQIGESVNINTLDAALRTPIDLPNLVVCQLIRSPESRTILPGRFCALPSHFHCRLRAPKLLHFTLSGFGRMLTHPHKEPYMMRPLQYQSWSIFCRNHTQLQELYVFGTNLPEPNLLADYFPNLAALCLANSSLPDDFLDFIRPERLPSLQHLLLSQCLNLNYSQFKNILKESQNELQYWLEYTQSQGDDSRISYGTAPWLTQTAQSVFLGTHEAMLQGNPTLGMP